MRVGLYLGDLRRSRTNSHGIINHAIGLAGSLPQHLLRGEELVLFVGNEIRHELPEDFSAGAHVVEVGTPQTAFARLHMDHLRVLNWACARDLDVLHFPKGHVPLGRPRGLRILATVHDDIPVRYRRGDFGAYSGRLRATYFSWATLRTLRRADHVLTDSAFSAESLVSHVPGVSTRLTVIPSAVSLPLLDPLPRAEKNRVLVHLGSRLAHKRSGEAVAWAREFLDTHPDYRLVVTGSLAPEVEALCRHSGVVRERRALTNMEMAVLIRGAAALIFPSTLEGFGLPPVEAACLGTPSVWARSTSLPEVMGEAPGSFSPRDRVGFLEALDEVVALSDHDLSSIAHTFRARYSWDSVARRTLDVYRALAASPPMRATGPERALAAVRFGTRRS